MQQSAKGGGGLQPFIIRNSLNSTATTRSVGFAHESPSDKNSRLKQ